MDLKTATLISLIGISFNAVLSFLSRFCMPLLLNISYYLPWVIWALSFIMIHGSFILFFAVFYSKQKNSESIPVK